nr:sigma-54 dependent transcriptional regulator [Pseudomonas aeruginosa]
MSPFAPFDAQTQVLLIDDDPHLRQALRQTLDLAGLKVATLDDARQLDTAQCKDWPGVVVSDIRMPGIDGMELLRQLHEQDADLPVILITGHGDVPLAVQAMRGGAYDFLEKPFPDGPFVAINAGALAESVVESELFGHEAGAFTGAQKRRIGKFEYANGGTLFLDEIESMSLDVQVKLLRLLQERVVERLGSNQLIPLDIRIIAATKEDLRQAADQGRFRADLYYRLNVASLRIPPLRERGEDIPLLFRHFAEAGAMRHGLTPRELDAGQSARLLAYDWPGNVRELQNAAERFALGLGLSLDDGVLPDAADEPHNLSAKVEAFERSLIAAELERPHNSLRSVAEALGIPRKTLHDKLRKHGLPFNTPGENPPDDGE